MTQNNYERGRAFELRVFNIIMEELAMGRLGLMPSLCEVFLRKNYPSRDRQAMIEFDVSIELNLPRYDTWSLLWVWECKDYNTPLPVGEIEKFWARLHQIAGVNVKGAIATTGQLQSGALSFAKSKGIMVVNISPSNEMHGIVASNGFADLRKVLIHRSSLNEFFGSLSLKGLLQDEEDQELLQFMLERANTWYKNVVQLLGNQKFIYRQLFKDRASWYGQEFKYSADLLAIGKELSKRDDMKDICDGLYTFICLLNCWSAKEVGWTFSGTSIKYLSDTYPTAQIDAPEELGKIGRILQDMDGKVFNHLLKNPK